MTTGAHVSSVEALGAFRAELALFIEKTTRALDEVSERPRQTRRWLENECLPQWEREKRRRARVLEQAEQELYQCRLNSPDRNLPLQQMLVRRAARALREAEEKSARAKKWMRDFDSAVDPLIKPVDRLRDRLGHILPKGLAFLQRAADALENYRSPPNGLAGPPASGPALGAGSPDLT